MSDLINFKVVRLQTELNKFNRHKSIPTSFLDGTFTIDDLHESYDELSARYQKIATKLIDKYSADINRSKDNLYDNFVKEYANFLENQCTRDSRWEFTVVLAKFRANINPVRALIYDARDAIKYFNGDNEHYVWLHSLLTDIEVNNELLDCIIRDRNTIDQILNHYHPLFVAGGVQLPIELLHMKQLRKDLLEYANFVTHIRRWEIE